MSDLTIKLLNDTFMPKLGMGTWGVGGYFKRDDKVPPNDWVSIITDAFDIGLRHIDTAEVYAEGASEEIIGNALVSSRKARSEFFISTKVRGDYLSYNNVIETLKKSLDRMQTDYVDLCYIHMPNDDIPLEETLSAFNYLVEEKLIKGIGVSNFSLSRLKKAEELSDAPIVAHQAHYNLIVREVSDTGLLQYCQNKKIALVGWRPLQFETHLNGVVIAPLFLSKAYSALDEMAMKYNVSQAQIAIAWLLQQEYVVPIIKASNKLHFSQMLDATKVILDANDWELLNNNFPVILKKSDAIPLG